MKQQLHKCDPDKNVNCPKTFCATYGQGNECALTVNPEYALVDADGKPIEADASGYDDEN